MMYEMKGYGVAIIGLRDVDGGSVLLKADCCVSEDLFPGDLRTYKSLMCFCCACQS